MLREPFLCVALQLRRPRLRRQLTAGRISEGPRLRSCGVDGAGQLLRSALVEGRLEGANACFDKPRFDKLSTEVAGGELSGAGDEAVDDALLAGLVEGDGEFVAFDLGHAAVAELLVEHPLARPEARAAAGG